MNILLIKPRWFVSGGQYRYLEHVKFTPLALGVLAAMSPGHQVTIVDGDWETIPTNKKFDLVGITVTTFTSQQAYRIAELFRSNGSQVVLGGVHPSLLPEECLRHADAVVVGEAEYVWDKVLADAEKRKLKRVYKAARITDLKDVPAPDYSGLKMPAWLACVQATRGCPNTCKYCYLHSVPWGGFRKRPLDEVAAEIKATAQKVLFIVDDNLFADRSYALDFFRALKPLKKTFAIQIPTTIEKDDELLDAMAQAGCFNVLVGLQSFNPKSLEWASVSHNRVAKYTSLAQKLHDRGILSTAFLMFGFDSDHKDVFDATVAAVKKIELDDANLYILTPYPGTPLHAQYAKEGRLLEGTVRTQFGWAHAVYKPKHMSPKELEAGVQGAYVRLHAHFQRRLPRAILSHLGVMLKNPRLALSMIGGSFRQGRVVHNPELEPAFSQESR